MDILTLNKEQQRAFNRLKKANEDCKKLGVLLVNQYGTMTAYNTRFIIGHGDADLHPRGHVIDYRDVIDKFNGNTNTFETCSGMADDEILWVLGLTDEGLKFYEEY